MSRNFLDENQGNPDRNVGTLKTHLLVLRESRKAELWASNKRFAEELVADAHVVIPVYR